MGGTNGLDLGSFGVWTFDFEDQSAARVQMVKQTLEAAKSRESVES